MCGKNSGNDSSDLDSRVVQKGEFTVEVFDPNLWDRRYLFRGEARRQLQQESLLPRATLKDLVAHVGISPKPSFVHSGEHSHIGVDVVVHFNNPLAVV
jgi:hypothetical protein